MGDLAPIERGQPLRPNFVIVGVPLDDGTVMVYASDELDEADLRVLHDDPDIEWHGPHSFVQGPSTGRYQLTCLTKRSGQGRYILAMAVGDTYSEALATIMTFWQPRDPDGPLALDAADRAG